MHRKVIIPVGFGHGPEGAVSNNAKVKGTADVDVVVVVVVVVVDVVVIVVVVDIVIAILNAVVIIEGSPCCWYNCFIVTWLKPT